MLPSTLPYQVGVFACSKTFSYSAAPREAKEDNGRRGSLGKTLDKSREEGIPSYLSFKGVCVLQSQWLGETPFVKHLWTGVGERECRLKN